MDGMATTVIVRPPAGLVWLGVRGRHVEPLGVDTLQKSDGRIRNGDPLPGVTAPHRLSLAPLVMLMCGRTMKCTNMRAALLWSGAAVIVRGIGWRGGGVGSGE